MIEARYDIAVIGGGLTGTAVARDAAGRGLSVLLCDQGDLGCGASSATSKLVHGGPRFLAGRNVAAIREAVTEREILMRTAPHLLKPTRFLLPYHSRMRPAGAIRRALAVFDRAGKTRLPAMRGVDLEAETAHGMLQGHFGGAFAFVDCIADDSRLVVLNAIDARTHGATIATGLRCTLAEREAGRWRLMLEAAEDGEPLVVHARALVNATGAAAVDAHNHMIDSAKPVAARLVKSTSIVVAGMQTGRDGYALTDPDGHLVFAFPWQEGALFIGPAERPARSADDVAVERSAVAYLLDVARQYIEEPLSAGDVVWVQVGVRAVPAEGDRAIVLDAPPRAPPLATVIGGSTTTARKVAEEVVDAIGRHIDVGPAWTAGAHLPGGGFPPEGGADLIRALRAGYPFLGERRARRLVRAYGTRASMILTGARSEADLGLRFGPELTESEVNYLVAEEWARTPEDILWRRTKLGLSMSSAGAAALAALMEDHPALAAAAQ